MLRPLVLLPFLTLGSLAYAQTSAPPPLPVNTPLWVKTDRNTPLKLGQAVQARLVYPLYGQDRLVLPAGTLVQGTITGLDPDRQHRLQARLRGDFTPFSHPVVQFRELLLPNGTRLPLPVGPAADGAPVLQLTPPPPRKGGFLRRQWDTGVGLVEDRLSNLTAPGKADRLEQLLYSQLPYHPQRIEAGTVWTLDTTAALNLPQPPVASPQPPAPASPASTAHKPAPDPNTWTVQAYLPEVLSSAHATVGQPIQAVVAEPVLDATGAVAVPQGATLRGEITRARPARKFGRAGELRFDFRQLSFPGQAEPEAVQTTLAGVDAAGGSNLSLDREGQVQPKPKDKVIVPLILLSLAGRPLDRDRGDNVFGKNAVASNSLGVLGFIVGTAGGWRNVAAGIGYYGSALAIYNRWIKRGEDTTFRRDTRIIVKTTPRRSAPMHTPTPGH